MNSSISVLETDLNGALLDIESIENRLEGISYYSSNDSTIVNNKLSIRSAIGETADGVENAPQMTLLNTSTDDNNKVKFSILCGVNNGQWSPNNNEGDIIFLCQKHGSTGGIDTYNGSYNILRHGTTSGGARFSLDPTGESYITAGSLNLEANLKLPDKKITFSNNSGNSKMQMVDEHLIMTGAVDGDIKLISDQGSIKLTTRDGFNNESSVVINDSSVGMGNKHLKHCFIHSTCTLDKSLFVRSVWCRLKMAYSSRIYFIYAQSDGDYFSNATRTNTGVVTLDIDDSFADGTNDFGVSITGRFSESDESANRGMFGTVLSKSHDSTNEKYVLKIGLMCNVNWGDHADLYWVSGSSNQEPIDGYVDVMLTC